MAPSPSLRCFTYSALSLLLSIPSTLAAVSMQSVQRIVGFPSTCIDAYNTNLPGCDADMFRGVGGTGQCTQDCFNQIGQLSALVSEACAGQEAGSGTVIGHLFIGDADTWLCGLETAPSTTAATPAPAPAASTSAESPPDATSTSTSTGETSTTDTAQSETTSSSASTSETTTLITLTSSTETDTSTSETSTSSTTSATAASANGGDDQIGITGGGSPFDIQIPSLASSPTTSCGAIIAAMLGVLLVVGRG